jgi:hypothetical protein
MNESGEVHGHSWFPAGEKRLSPGAMPEEPVKSGHVCQRCATMTAGFDIGWDFVSSFLCVGSCEQDLELWFRGGRD